MKLEDQFPALYANGGNPSLEQLIAAVFSMNGLSNNPLVVAQVSQLVNDYFAGHIDRLLS